MQEHSFFLKLFLHISIFKTQSTGKFIPSPCVSWKQCSLWNYYFFPYFTNKVDSVPSPPIPITLMPTSHLDKAFRNYSTYGIILQSSWMCWACLQFLTVHCIMALFLLVYCFKKNSLPENFKPISKLPFFVTKAKQSKKLCPVSSTWT